MCGFDDCLLCRPRYSEEDDTDDERFDEDEDYQPEDEEVEDEDYDPMQDVDEFGELTPRAKSALDPGGVYSSDGECIGRIRTCSCEDYPCCGH
jgi:hypothetical protein